MISTKLHGVLDYAASGLLGAAAGMPVLSAPVRRTLGAAAAYHAGYAAATDYPAGLRPWLTMRQHLMLDALGAAGLCAAGLALRRESTAQRGLLIAAGLAEWAIIGAGVSMPTDAASPRPRSSGGAWPTLARRRTTTAGRSVATPSPSADYPPIDTPKRVADEVWIVDSTLPMPAGTVLPVRMTVIRLPNGELLLHSPTRLIESLRRALLDLGPVAHLVAPNSAHWLMVKPWQDAFPAAATYAAPGLRDRRQVRRSGLRIDAELGRTHPAAWDAAIEPIVVPGGFGFHEVALFHRPSRTLVLTDFVLNLEPAKLSPPFRLVFRAFGSTAPDGMPPPYLRLAIRMRRRPAVAAAREMLRLRPERVIFAHGQWFDRAGAERLRRSLRWLLPNNGPNAESYDGTR